MGGCRSRLSPLSYPRDTHNNQTKHTGEPFVQFWDPRSSQWLYRNATEAFVVDGRLVRQGGGMSPPSHVKKAGSTVLVHWLCFQATDGVEAAQMLMARGAGGDGEPANGGGGNVG